MFQPVVGVNDRGAGRRLPAELGVGKIVRAARLGDNGGAGGGGVVEHDQAGGVGDSGGGGVGGVEKAESAAEEVTVSS